MGDHANKRGVFIYLPSELHRSLRRLSIDKGKSMSVLVEEAALQSYGAQMRADGLILARESEPSYEATTRKLRKRRSK